MAGTEPGLLFVVGTPIGNLGDLSPRAVETLRGVDRIVAEDTRRSRPLLTHFGIERPLVAVEAHTSQGRIDRLVSDLLAGTRLAVVTDAGMPGVSDPGAALITAARRAGVRVVSIPGPSAVTTLIASSGLVEGPFLFLGFLARKGKRRAEQFARIVNTAEPVVLFEAPGRARQLLLDLGEHCPTREVCVGRELTKLHEELLWGTATELAEKEEWRGEVTLVLGPGDARRREVSDSEVDERIRLRLAEGVGASLIAKELAAWSGRPRRELYARVLQLTP